jgi:hypothetical protein
MLWYLWERKTLHLFILLKGNGMVVTHKHNGSDWRRADGKDKTYQTLIDEPFFLQPVMKG